MKTYFILLLVVTATVHAQQQKQTGFRVEGHISGLKNLTGVSISDANKTTDTLAKTRVKDGVFILTGQVTEPNLLLLNFLEAGKKTTLFIGNESVTIQGDIENLAAARISGSASEDDFLTFQKRFNPYFAHINQLSQLANAPEATLKRDSIGNAYQLAVAALQLQVDSFILKRNSSYVSPFLLVVVNQLSDDIFLLERRFKSLTPKVQQSMFGQYLNDQIENGKIGALGTDALDFTQTDTSGKPVTLSSFKGKYVLVDFWASWCKPCRMENPNVLAAYERFKSKNFTILGVSLDRSRDAWIRAIQDDKLTWSQVSDLKFWNNAVAQQYRIQQIPQNFLIDPNGKIVGKNLRGADLDSRLCALLGCN